MAASMNALRSTSLGATLEMCQAPHLASSGPISSVERFSPIPESGGTNGEGVVAALKVQIERLRLIKMKG